MAGHSQLDVQRLAQQAAQEAAARVLFSFAAAHSQSLSLPGPEPPITGSPPQTLPPSLGGLPIGPPTYATSSTPPTWVYQPPAATPQQVLDMRASLAPPTTTARTDPGSSLAIPPLPQLAPFSGSIPSIPPRFAATAAAGEFVDFNELLHALEVDGGEEQPICLQIGQDQHLEVPRKPRKRPMSTFQDWVRCFSVYAHQLAACQPMRSTDLMGYLYLIATCQIEFSFQACMA